MLNKIMNPDLYHGHKKKKNFFEGWYFKIVDKNNENVIAFIPGIIKGSCELEHHSFIQVLDGSNNNSSYIKYGVNSFKAEKKTFEVTIENNFFSLNELRLNILHQDKQILGTLKFIDILRWPDSIINPGSMGFYNYLLFMECYSQVSCLNGKVIGKIMVNGKEIDYTGGSIYIEKNWGSSFPQAYIWIHSNSFKNKNISFTCSLGRVPMPFFTFSGFLAALTIDDQVYKFTTINKTKVEKIIEENNVKLTFIKDDLKLIVETMCKDKDFILCKGPNRGQMDINVKESLTSIIKVELIDLYKERMIFSGVGECSGIELMGDLNII